MIDPRRQGAATQVAPGTMQRVILSQLVYTYLMRTYPETLRGLPSRRPPKVEFKKFDTCQNTPREFPRDLAPFPFPAIAWGMDGWMDEWWWENLCGPERSLHGGLNCPVYLRTCKNTGQDKYISRGQNLPVTASWLHHEVLCIIHRCVRHSMQSSDEQTTSA